jgi:multiple sugar transport system ATP-binding protein
MTVYDNMAFGLKIRKMPKDEIDKRVREAAKILDIEQYLDRKPKALSGGQRQRVAVGRAIVRQPKVFLFDEPLSNLDAKLRVQMRAEITGLHHRLKSTMIYVTHDQVEALTMGTKIVVMKDGKVQQIGAPLYLYSHPINKFVAGFIGSPPMNFLTVTVKEAGGKVIVDEGNFTLTPTAEQGAKLKAYVGKEVFLGIRPEDLEYTKTPDSANNVVATV